MPMGLPEELPLFAIMMALTCVEEEQQSQEELLYFCLVQRNKNDVESVECNVYPNIKYVPTSLIVLWT